MRANPEDFCLSSAEPVYNPDSQTYCARVGDILDLKGQKTGRLEFVGGVEGWREDHQIFMSYSIDVTRSRHWQDESVCDEIRIQLGDFEGKYNSKTIGNSREEQLYVEQYLESKGIDIMHEIRKVYFGEE